MNPIRQLDDFLNSITMYRLVVYSLWLLLAVAFVFMATGVLSYSTAGFAVTTGIVLTACFVANMLFSKVFNIPANFESGMITALILSCILPQTATLERALLVALTGVLAIAVKFVLVWRGSHFLNPAATGALAVSLLGLLPITWWIANPSMFLPTLLLGVLVLRKIRRFTLLGVFAAGAAAMMLLASAVQGIPAGEALRTLAFSYPLLFLGVFMLTEPTTMPAGRLNIALYGLLVGVLLASPIEVGPADMTPHLALVIGNLFSLVVSPKRGVRLRLKSRTTLAPHTYDLAFELPNGTTLPYKAGQYMEWTVPFTKYDSRSNRRTFTLASSPTEPELHIGVKTYEPSSVYKQYLLAMKPGDGLLAGHINGGFTLPADASQKLLFVAGGIGITPFRSMVKYLTDIGQSRDITLVYAARPGEFAYKADFEAAAGLGVKTMYFSDTLTAVKLTELVPDYAERMAYISGPPGLVANVKRSLRLAGVSRFRIRTDLFTGY